MGRKKRAELRLPARTLGEHHQALGHAQRHFRAVVLGQQVQVDPRRDAGRGVELAVLYVEAIGLDLGRGAQTRQVGGIAPMGGDGFAHGRAGYSCSAP